MARRQRQSRIDLIEQRGLADAGRSREDGDLPRQVAAQYIDALPRLRRDAHDGIADCLVVAQEILPWPLVEVHLVDADDDLRDARPLREHEKAVQEKRMEVRSCRRERQDDLREIGHCWPAQQVHARQLLFDDARAIRQQLDGDAIARHDARALAPLLELAAQLAAHEPCFRHDIEKTVVRLDDATFYHVPSCYPFLL